MVNAVRVWILLSTLLVGAGWILSALHQLNRTGYLTVFSIAAIASIWWLKKNKISPAKHFRRALQKFSQRFSRLPPFLFLLLALLVFVAGSLYPVSNAEANAYRLPRVCHWLWENQWHWIHTSDPKMNIVGCGWEWLAAPLVLFNGSDRLLFLINWVSFLMLPGLIFSVLTRLKILPRIAWWWMWFLAAGWCFVFQAGSGGDDSMAAVYALAAVDLALRARIHKKIGDFWLSLLAVALLTGIKQVNLPLAALWLVAAWPQRRLIFSKPISTAAVMAVAILISIVPISVANFIHYGKWLPLENGELAAYGNYTLNPFWGIVGNAFCIPAQNLWPPFSEFLPPYYGQNILEWNYWMMTFLNTKFGACFASFENFGYLNLSIDKSPGEGTAGIGFGICILIFATLCEKWRLRKAVAKTFSHDAVLKILRRMPWVLLLIFMAKDGAYENARQLAPYYLFLFPTLLTAPVNEMICRQRSWQNVGIATMILTVLLVVTSPARPLFPAQKALNCLSAHFPDNEILKVECDRYFETYQNKIQIRRERLQNLLPSQEKIIGYAPGTRGCDEPAICLPYGNRRARWILPDDSLEQLRQKKIHYLLTSDSFLNESHLSLADWMKRYDAILINECNDLSASPSHSVSPNVTKLYLVRIDQSRP